MNNKKTKGQSVVEFAMTVPIFLWLVMGIFDLGHGIASYALLGNAAREGSRAGIYAYASDANIIAAINAETLFLGAIPSGNIAITPSDPIQRTSGSNITVAITYVFQPITPLIQSVVGSAITLHASSTMLIE